MEDKKPTYFEGLGWRYEVEHSMLRRMQGHDYSGRCIYMITLTTEGRLPLLGTLKYEAGKPEDATIEPTPLGAEVLKCWAEIPQHYPEVKLLAFQLMPDHIHGLLFITKKQTAHLGQMVNGFKVGCTHAYWAQIDMQACAGAIVDGGCMDGMLSTETYKFPNPTPPTPHEGQILAAQEPSMPRRHGLFSPGYQDSILTGEGQLERMFAYISDNPRRLAVKRENPALFRIVRQVNIGGTEVNGQTEGGIICDAIGNHWLLDRPVRMQVRCHNNQTPENLRLIAKQKEYFLDRGAKEGVVVSPCISAGEKEIARACLDAGVPLIVILENGFPPMYKPPGKYFEACAKGLLLMLAPWPYHTDRRTITRQQCLALNDMASQISTEPWTEILEHGMLSS